MHHEQMPVDRDAYDEKREEDLKQAINNVLWMYAPSHSTLDQLENVALKMFSMIRYPANYQE